MIVEVVLEGPVNNCLEYKLNSLAVDPTVVGRRAIVPFGKRKLSGVIVGVKKR